jgi:DNA-binding NarL/FixJ family response regulator
MPDIRVLIAEDSTLLRRLLVHQLNQEADLSIVGEAKNGRETVDLVPTLRPDVILMDLDMPVLNGAQATERITTQYPHIKVILLTAHEDLATLGRFSGAFSSLSKASTPAELLTEIRRAHSMRKQNANTSESSGNHTMAIEVFSTRAALSDLERQVLEIVINEELTLKEIAATLSAASGKEVSTSSVKHTLQRVMTKMRVEPRTRAALVKCVLEFQQSLDARELDARTG